MEAKDLIRLARRARLVARSPLGEIRAEGLPAILVAATGLVGAIGIARALSRVGEPAPAALHAPTPEGDATPAPRPLQRGWRRAGS